MKFFYLCLIGSLLGALLGSCQKSPAVDPVVSDTTHTTPPDTTHKPPVDTTRKDTTTPTKPIPGITRAFTIIVETVDLHPADQSIWYFGASGDSADILIYQTDTSHYGIELINYTKGTWTLSPGNPYSDWDVSNIIHDTVPNQKIDTAGVLAFHIFDKKGGNLQPGIKDVYLYLETVPGNVVGKGQVSIAHSTTDKSLLTAQWMADKFKNATFNLTRFYVGNEQGQ